MVSEDTLVLSVSATDSDSGLNGKINYRLLSSPLQGFYIVPDNGRASLTEKLWYKRVIDRRASLNVEDIYTLKTWRSSSRLRDKTMIQDVLQFFSNTQYPELYTFYGL